MTHNEFLKDKSNKNWEAYRKQRNLVTKLKKQSIRTYFYERCVGNGDGCDYDFLFFIVACSSIV
jgi:hypothetical protein